MSRGLLNIWRRQARQAPREDGAFVRLRVAESCEEEGQASARQVASTGDGERIEIAIGGATVRVPVGVEARTLEQVLAALRSAR
ncbi:MAG: hypothetical protein ABSF67_14180 [Roseiarcus sp.]